MSSVQTIFSSPACPVMAGVSKVRPFRQHQIFKCDQKDKSPPALLFKGYQAPVFLSTSKQFKYSVESWYPFPSPVILHQYTAVSGISTNWQRMTEIGNNPKIKPKRSQRKRKPKSHTKAHVIHSQIQSRNVICRSSLYPSRTTPQFN